MKCSHLTHFFSAPHKAILGIWVHGSKLQRFWSSCSSSLLTHSPANVRDLPFTLYSRDGPPCQGRDPEKWSRFVLCLILELTADLKTRALIHEPPPHPRLYAGVWPADTTSTHPCLTYPAHPHDPRIAPLWERELDPQWQPHPPLHLPRSTFPVNAFHHSPPHHCQTGILDSHHQLPQ